MDINFTKNAIIKLIPMEVCYGFISVRPIYLVIRIAAPDFTMCIFFEDVFVIVAMLAKY